MHEVSVKIDHVNVFPVLLSNRHLKVRKATLIMDARGPKGTNSNLERRPVHDRPVTISE